jgi:hypothetical protein
MTDPELRAQLENLDLVEQLRLASEALINAADEIVRLRGDLEISVKYGEKLRRELTHLHMEVYS